MEHVEPVEIAGGETSLPGLLIRPEGARALYVLAHGAGAGMRHAFMESAASSGRGALPC